MTEEEFDAFYAASFSRLVSQLWAVTGDLVEAQDVVQDAFVRAWDHRRSLDAQLAPEAWVRVAATRLAISRWRRARGAVTAWNRHGGYGGHGGHGGHGELHATPEPLPDHVALVAALNRIPAPQRIAIVLHHLCDLSIEDVAAETSAPVGTVKARLSRGRAALAPLLRDELPEVSHG